MGTFDSHPFEPLVLVEGEAKPCKFRGCGKAGSAFSRRSGPFCCKEEHMQVVFNHFEGLKHGVNNGVHRPTLRRKTN